MWTTDYTGTRHLKLPVLYKWPETKEPSHCHTGCLQAGKMFHDRTLHVCVRARQYTQRSTEVNRPLHNWQQKESFKWKLSQTQLSLCTAFQKSQKLCLPSCSLPAAAALPGWPGKAAVLLGTFILASSRGLLPCWCPGKGRTRNEDRVKHVIWSNVKGHES